MTDIISNFRNKKISADTFTQDVITNADEAIQGSFETEQDKTEARATSVKLEKPKRGFLKELFHSLVWLYAKMITPILIVTVLICLWGIYVLFSGDVISKLQSYGIVSLVIIAGGALYAMFASLKYDYFKGIPVSRQEAPSLWAKIDEISNFADCPTITHLYIDNEFNASASISDAKGLKRSRELEVTIGLPLLSALSEDEAASVIAHEFGHHHGDDSRRSLAIYYAIQRARIISRIAIPDYHYGQLVLLPVSILFWIYAFGLRLLSQKIRHQCEYDADNFAASICGVDATGRTDIAMAVFGEDIMRVLWEPVHDAYRTGTQIPDNLFDNLPERFKDALKPEEFASKLSEEMKRETEFFDSHPSTKDRLENIGAVVALPKFESENTAARVWLGDEYSTISQKLQKHWMKDFTEAYGDVFKEKGKHAARAKQVLSEIEQYLESNSQNAETTLAKFYMSLELASDDEISKICNDAIESGIYIPDLEQVIAAYELEDGKVSGIDRLLDLIENQENGVCVNAQQTLMNWSDYCGDIDDKHQELKNVFSSKDFKESIKQLKPIAKAADKQHFEFKKTCDTLEIAQFPEWQKNAILSYFKLNTGISAAWMHICTDDDINGHNYYYLTIVHKTQGEADWTVCFDNFDSVELAVNGTVMFERMIGEGDVKSLMNNGKNFPALYNSLMSNPPLYVRSEELTEQVKQEISNADWGYE